MTVIGSDISPQNTVLSPQTLDYESLFARVEAGNTLITANSRLARVLTDQFSQWCIEQGGQQWQSPAILPWNLWLDDLWETAGLQGVDGCDRAVPGKRQLISLWERTLREESLEHQLLNPESLASQLQETRSLMIKWHLSFKDGAWFSADNENHQAFYHWNKAFEKLCAVNQWISPEDRGAVLVTAINTKQLTIDGSFDLLGFDELDPSQQSLLAALNQHGGPLSLLTITSRQQKAGLWSSKDHNDELQTMARWVRHWHETEPGSRIAVVVHDLQLRRDEVERQLAAILTPGADSGKSPAKPWNISMGMPLSRVTMIEAAFDLLKLLDFRIDIQDVGRVLRSPWLRGANEERNCRALLEKCLRDKYPRQLKLTEVSYRASEIKTHDHHRKALPPEEHGPQPWHSPGLSAVLASISKFGRENSRKAAPSRWAESFDQLLLSLGWPWADEAPQDHDDNWQALQSWRDALRELASLDATTGMLDRNAAIRQLRQICRESIFQARSSAASIQVLGLYEASALRFDHLWVLGLHNENWPPSARPNPFIPRQLQQAAGIPNSSPQRELEVARTITQRLLETAPDCIFSYPSQVDAEEIMPSPLLGAADIVQNQDLPGWQGDSWQAAVAKADGASLHPLIMPGPLTYGTARGGSSILKHQALCPFRAFASNRLGADGLEIPADGISAMLHGSLVHSVLEFFWRETQTQAALLALGEDALSARVRVHVDQVIADERGLQQRPSFKGVEADRLQRHVLDFLELDKQREAFDVVGFEEEILPVIEGQSIRLIIDRIDKLANGEEIIIDYKSGKIKPDKWFSERPEDPQLPLYAISAEKTPAGVAFGIVRDDKCEYLGVVKREGLLPDLPNSHSSKNYLNEAGLEMSATIENWREILHRLMADFLAGEASVDPKQGFNTCNNSYCELQSLCRVKEQDQRNKASLDMRASEKLA